MLTKLRTNPGAYDVVLINSAFTRQAAGEGLIQAIDTSDMKNVTDLSPNMRDNDNFIMDGRTFGIAWLWSAGLRGGDPGAELAGLRHRRALGAGGLHGEDRHRGRPRLLQLRDTIRQTGDWPCT